jgi:hypothetical protein
VQPGTNGGKALRLACNADCVRGKKLELEEFLSDHGVDIFLLNEAPLESGRALWISYFTFKFTQIDHRRQVYL